MSADARWAVLAIALAGCGGARAGGPASSLADVDRARASAGAKLAAEGAPEAYAQAEEQRRAAIAAGQAGDERGAELLAARAVAKYERALVLARLAQAKRAEAEAVAAKSVAEGSLRDLAASRTRAERDGEELDKRIVIARETLAPPPSGTAAPEREAARLVAARSLATQARLLCASARLLTEDAPGLAAAEADVTRVEQLLDTRPKPAPIDASARARAACLSTLTRARRAAKDPVTGQPDALLAELSAASWAPERDERGVVVVLRDAFRGNAVADPARPKLEQLGRVAAAHPGVAVQVVVHDAQPDARPQAGAARAQAAVEALVKAGAPAERTRGESAGGRAPLVDPADAAHRARNARLEIVFLTPGT